MSLVDWLEERRQELGLANGAFATRLGISRPAWSLLKHGKRRPGIKAMAGALALFPAEHAEIVQLIASDRL